MHSSTARADGRHWSGRREPAPGRRRRAGREARRMRSGDGRVLRRGAVQAGHFHETVNLAALWELPVIFVCENNGMAEFTPRSAHTEVERCVTWSRPMGSRAEVVDGWDVASRVERVRRVPGGPPATGRGWAGTISRLPHPPVPRPLRRRPAGLPRRAGRRSSGPARPDRGLEAQRASNAAGSASDGAGDRARARAEVEAAVEFAGAAPRARGAAELVYADDHG